MDSNDALSGQGTRRRTVLKGLAAGGVSSVLAGVGKGAERAGGRTDRYIVGTGSSATAAAEATAARGAAAATSRARAVDGVLDLNPGERAVAGRFSEQALEALERRRDVRYIERDHRCRSTAQTIPWGVDRISAEKTAAAGYSGSGADIALLDSGIDEAHPDLRPNLGNGISFVDYTSSWDDDAGHGTHTAGIAGAVDNRQGVVGVAPAPTLHAVKVLDATNFGYYSWMAAGLEWAADQGYEVVSISIAGTEPSHTLVDACRYANDRGVLVVASAGNEDGGTVTYPAKYPMVLAVSATTKDDTIAGFSSVGSEVELAAPGTLIRSAVPGGYGYKQGTSMACPHVSGVAGLLMASEGGDLSNSQARQRLRDTAEDIGLTGDEQGYGLVDAGTALDSQSPGEPTPQGGSEVGSVTIQQSDANGWRTVDLDGSYSDPVVVMGPASANGGNPVHVRLRNVAAGSFEFQLEEWDYHDNRHMAETVSYLVLEAGRHTLSDGTSVEAGTTRVDHAFTSTKFDGPFDTAPVVVTHAQTRNGLDAMVTRQRAVSADGFDLRVQEEETGGAHMVERVGYVAVEPGTGTLVETRFEVGRPREAVTDGPSAVGFDQEMGSEPVFLAGMQTFDGPDPAGLRYLGLDGNGVEVFVEEGRSRDEETFHTGEEVGYLVFGGESAIHAE